MITISIWIFLLIILVPCIMGFLVGMFVGGETQKMDQIKFHDNWLLEMHQAKEMKCEFLRDREGKD